MIRWPPRRGLRANVVAAFAAGALLISLILAFSTYFSARHYLIVQRERNALQQAYINAALVKERLRTNGVNVAEVLSEIAPPRRTTVLVRQDGQWYSSDLTTQVHDATSSVATSVEATDDPDLATLTGSFNTMVDTVVERLDHDARFAADVSHELRTPVATLTTSLGVLQGDPTLSPSSATAVGLMAGELDRFRGALEDLITLGRLDAGVRESEWEVLSVADLVAATLAEAEIGGQATVDVSSDLAIYADRLQVHRALANLVRNAETHGGGLTAVRAIARRGYAEIHVADSGPGVPAAERERIFDRFARTGARGTTTGSGLGLSIVEQTAQLHDGSVWCREADSGGADFVLSFPLAPTARTASGREAT